MERFTQYDISTMTFEEFIEFLFDHEVIPFPDNPQNGRVPWYLEAEVIFNPINIANYYIQLFTEPEFLLTRFSSEQLEQGFWAIQSSNIECAVTEIVWLEDIPKELRKKCVRSMYYLFRKLFSTNSLETSSHMWWDSIAYDWHCNNRNRSNGGEDLWMQDVMFDTLKETLELPCLECKLAALHGLGHLHHPDTSQLIDQWLRNNKKLDSEVRKYAIAASRFEVM
jgi:hypothetical protein